VVQVQELGHESGELFLVMEYLEGETVVALMKRLSEELRLLPWSVASYLAAQACAGLAAAHELTGADGQPLHLVHRDIAPDNIFITYEGQVKLLDFGIAKARDRLAHTRTGHVRGKAPYMSPEQILGEEIDHRSDLYSLGVVLHEISTGQRLFKGQNDLALAKAICEGPVPPPSRLRDGYPAALEQAVLCALARRREDRFASAKEMQAALEPFASGPSELAALMAELFGERIGLKAQLLAGLKESEAPSAVTRTLIHEVNQPVEPRLQLGPSPVRPLSVTLRWAGALALLLALGAAAIAGLSGRGPGPSSAPAAMRPPAQALPVDAPPAAPPPARVKLDVASIPPGARVSIDGREAGQAPLRLELPRGSTEVQLILELSGYEPLSWKLRPEVDTALQLSLVRRPPPPRPSASARPNPRPQKSPVRDFHRFD
jgi:serine/threonine-protein kinase